ncbi:MAG: RNA methyltransferase [Ilumatobacteraceae bacterium]
MPGSRIPVDDPDDPALAVFFRNERGLASRAQRRDDAGTGLFLAEGDLVVERALDAGCEPVSVLADGADPPPVVDRLTDAHGIDVFMGGERLRRAITGLGVIQPVVAVFRRPARPAARELVDGAARLVVVEGVDNPTNVGSIVRNAAAFGWDGLLLDHTSADPLARRSLRVAMGTVFSLPHARTGDLVSALTAAAASGVIVLALTPDGGGDGRRGGGNGDEIIDVGTLDLADHVRRAVLIGAEREGLSRGLLQLATHRVRIPMADGVDSLNAAAATAVACYALR